MNTNKKQKNPLSIIVGGGLLLVVVVTSLLVELEKEEARSACGLLGNITVASNSISISIGRIKKAPQSSYQAAIDELRELMPRRIKHCLLEEVDRNAIDLLREIPE